MLARSRISPQLALFVGAALAILAGASFNSQGRTGETAILALLAGLLAFGSGVAYRWWRYAAGGVVLALLVELLTYGFDLHSHYLWVTLAGLIALVAGGMLAYLAYSLVLADLQTRMQDLERLNQRLEEQHRVFLAATEDPTLQSGGPAELAQNTARQTSSPIACYYLANAEGTQFVPQPPGFGMTAFHPQAVDRKRTDEPVIAAVEANQEFATTDPRHILPLFNFLPPDFRLESALVVPIRMGDRVGGFVLLANKPGGYSPDDRRLATTLAMRAGAHLASMHAVALSQKEAERYALLNELVKQASGLSFDQVLGLVLERGTAFVPHDAARVAVFGENSSYTMVGGSAVPAPITGSLEQVRGGQTVIRAAVTRSDGLFSGLEPGEGGAVAEALVPIRGKRAVLGAICLGRRRANSFTDADMPALDELGTMAGVAVENAHALEQVSGQATKLDTALNALGEISQALTAVTEGAEVLERKTLESAARLYGVRHALITRAVDQARHRVLDGIGFDEGVSGAEIQNGQGVVGAAMLAGKPIAVTDLGSSWESVDDPTLVAYGVRSSLTVPVLEGDRLWGTLSVFDVQPRTWTEDDVRVLSTLGNEAVVALKNAELYDASKKMIWELTNLHEGLKAVTSTLELDHVLELVLGWAGKAADAQIGCLALVEGGKLKIVGSYGTDHATAEKLALELGGDIARGVLVSGEPVMAQMDDVQSGSGPLFPRSVLCVPIMLRDQATGIVFLANYQVGHPFTDDHRRLLTALAAQAAISIDNAKLFKDRQELFLGSLKALADAVDARDPYTAGHSQRVTQYALMIAREMEYAPGDREAWRRLEQGGLLHDIGKIAVPDAILAKPGRLTEAEFAIMKSHPGRGYDILQHLSMLTDELKIVRSHHERFDGKGYPDQLAGDQLPIFVWIVGGADALDAMTSDRPYRKGMTWEEALGEVEKGAGTHFHPAVAQAMIQAAQKGTLHRLEQKSMYADAPKVGAFENPVSA